jgi:hypothetical protein
MVAAEPELFKILPTNLTKALHTGPTACAINAPVGLIIGKLWAFFVFEHYW